MLSCGAGAGIDTAGPAGYLWGIAALQRACCHRRHYTTPQSYLDLIELYKGLLKGQRSATGDARERLLNGLAKLGETNEQVEQMRGELSALQPVIQEKSQARPQ